MKLTEKFVKTAGVLDGLTEKWYADDDQPELFLRSPENVLPLQPDLH